MVINAHGPHIGRRERNKTRIRQQLRDAALQLFRSEGYEATTVQQIADAADTAKATFFNYYPTKEHLLGEFHSALVQEILAQHGAQTYRSARLELVGLARTAARLTNREPELVAALVRNLWGSPVLAEVDHSIGTLFSGAVDESLARGQASGELRSDVDLNTAVALIMSVLNGCVLDWVMAEPKFNLAIAAARRMSLLLAAFEP